MAEPLEHRKFLLPQLLQDIADVIGLDNAVKVARRFGGQNIWIHKKVKASQPLPQLLGVKAVQLLELRFGYGRMRIPSANPYLHWYDARAWKKAGKSTREIAEIMKLDERTIGGYLKGFDPATDGEIGEIEPPRECSMCGRRYPPQRKASDSPRSPAEPDLFTLLAPNG